MIDDTSLGNHRYERRSTTRLSVEVAKCSKRFAPCDHQCLGKGSSSDSKETM